MKILVSGASGLIGSALVPALAGEGHQVLRLVRRPPRRDEASWDPVTGVVDPAALAGADALVHLAGENIAGRWTAGRKRRIRASRVEVTRSLCETLARSASRPGVLVCASAIGYYGDRGTEPLTEDSAPGHGFLADVCRDWEAATGPAAQSGIRVVNVRFGVVLSPRGGALAKVLLPFRLGLGGVVGNGRQFWSWVALEDVVGAIRHALVTDRLRGPVNVVAPNPVPNSEFTRTLGRVLRRPTIFPLPAPAARLLLGEMADALLLASAQVQPIRLEGSGYPFQFRDLEPALRSLLGLV